MAEYKPLGSEKLKGDDKLKRILELTYYKNSSNKTNKVSPELVSETKTGGVYGIVKEKDGYYVKRGLNESSLDYIGGLFMKNKNKFSSYAEALKRLELLKGQEELNEATKYVLKNKQQTEAPTSEPSLDVPPPPPQPTPNETQTPDASGMENLPMPNNSGEELPTPELGDDTTSTEQPSNKPSDYMSEVQKYAGKLGQELRDQKEKMESDDIKYVLNMIISAVDLNKLDLEDLEEIGKKFERDEEMDSEVPTEEPELDTEIPSEPEPESPDQELGEVDPIHSLESFVNSSFDMDDMNETDEIDFSKYADIDEEDDLREIDLDEIKMEINKSVSETLSKYFK
jgi:hypothetical protein